MVGRGNPCCFFLPKDTLKEISSAILLVVIWSVKSYEATESCRNSDDSMSNLIGSPLFADDLDTIGVNPKNIDQLGSVIQIVYRYKNGRNRENRKTGVIFVFHHDIKHNKPLLVCVAICWRHQMETFSALLAIWAGNSPVTDKFPAQRPVTRSFGVFFDLHLNKRLSKQWLGWWLRRRHVHYDVTAM